MDIESTPDTTTDLSPLLRRLFARGVVYGCDYNPDQWPEAYWPEDVRLMREAGVNLVSLGIFSWARIQPEPDVFDFAWLDRIIELLHAHGIGINLATPTASPPAWLVRLHPDVLPQRADGVTLWHGSRRHYCPHSSAYREYSGRLVKALAQRYAHHPAVVLWHVDNEYGVDMPECFCDASAAAFRTWLQHRYGSIEALNAAWGTAFWSQAYADWSEIVPPRTAPTFANPTQQLDWKRFSSESFQVCFEDQKAILCQAETRLPIATNFMGFFKPIDYWAFAAREDLVANDNYPDTAEPNWMVGAAMTCDLMRSLRHGQPWVLMEQSPTHVNWRKRNTTKRPGVMRLGSYQAVARGADGVMFFQWRASRAGAEKFHSAMLPHAGTATRVWREVQALGKELETFTDLVGSRVKADVAILFDWNNWWALELDARPSADVKLLEQVSSYYETLYRRNVVVDFVHPGADLSAYRVVIVPTLYLVDPAAAANLNAYVTGGGSVVLTFSSGIVDGNDHVHLGGYPAPFREMLGLWVEESAPQAEGQTNRVRTSDGRCFVTTLWSDILHLEGAEGLAHFVEDYYAGAPAVTRHRFGAGISYYVGAALAQDGIDWLIGQVIAQAGVRPVLADLPSGVEAVQRGKPGQSWVFVFNYNVGEVSIPLNTQVMDRVSGHLVVSELRLPAAGVAVLQLGT